MKMKTRSKINWENRKPEKTEEKGKPKKRQTERKQPEQSRRFLNRKNQSKLWLAHFRSLQGESYAQRR
jgi:hypothetical protein